MPGWDENSAQLIANLAGVLGSIRDLAQGRSEFRAEDARRWHGEMMAGLQVPKEEWRGAFRGEEGLQGLEVKVGMRLGVSSSEVSDALEQFDQVLQRLLSFLDVSIPVECDPSDSQIEAVVETCARVHAEWVRIHPFANGNGPTARLWANAIAMRYGLPPFVRLRPRPKDGGYALAAEGAMTGNPEPSIDCFRRLLRTFFEELE